MIPPRRVVITSRDQGLLQVSQGLLQVRQGLLHVIRRLLHVLSKLVGDGRWLHHVVSEVLEVVGGQADVVRRSEADGSSSSNYAELNDTNGGGASTTACTVTGGAGIGARSGRSLAP